MKFTFDIKDEYSLDALNAFCLHYSYEEFPRILDQEVKNPESKQAFAERILKEMFVAPYKTQIAQEAANERLDIINQDL